MKHLKNIVFDFGGVLIDWNPVYLYKKVFDSEEQMSYFLENICSSEWNIQQDKGRPLSEATELLQKKHPEYKNEIEMYYGRWTEMLGGLFEENVKLIKPLKEKYKVYGLTNWSAETIPHAMERYGFFKDLDGIVVSGEEKLINYIWMLRSKLQPYSPEYSYWWKYFYSIKTGSFQDSIGN
jgi:2-haloacid dehalogenase